MPTLDELLAGLSYNELVVFYDRLMRAASELTPDAQAPSAGSLPKDNILAVTRQQVLDSVPKVLQALRELADDANRSKDLRARARELLAVHDPDRDLFTRSINPCISAHYSRSEEPTAHPAGGRSEIGTPG